MPTRSPTRASRMIGGVLRGAGLCAGRSAGAGEGEGGGKGPPGAGDTGPACADSPGGVGPGGVGPGGGAEALQHRRSVPPGTISRPRFPPRMPLTVSSLP
eukprot:1187624-Prorocentrum_minimum.AAC.2